MIQQYQYQKIRTHPVFINFDNDEEIDNLGKYLEAICINKQNDVSDTLIFYKNGIKEFDQFLNGVPEYHFNLSMQMASFQNAFVFFLYQPDQKKYAVKKAIWRDRILGVFYHKESQKHTLLKATKKNKWFSKFNSEVSVPNILSLQPLQDKPKKGQSFILEKDTVRTVSLKYRNSKNTIDEIQIYIRAKHKNEIMLCLFKHFCF
ncbi:hypothetical protein [Planktosalinus lacus]|uniref:Uncharacterized protein n=1 Tax=Planktosalinus lacus TaxID=1526573 RepID=A0A8J2YC85_9FLAO|nr:hypothetical protein [Planktosalinus lacus]GGE00106.1 hypothetical protein GCM10011312_24500 [Planktosalinus lacus]